VTILESKESNKEKSMNYATNVKYELLTFTLKGWQNLVTDTNYSSGEIEKVSFDTKEDALDSLNEMLRHGDDADDYMIVKVTRERA